MSLERQFLVASRELLDPNFARAVVLLVQHTDEGAMGLVARKMKITLPADLAIDAEVDLCLTDGAYFLQARLNVSLPGVERGVAQALVDAAHKTCPYSKGARGNIEVAINLV